MLRFGCGQPDFGLQVPHDNTEIAPHVTKGFWYDVDELVYWVFRYSSFFIGCQLPLAFMLTLGHLAKGVFSNVAESAGYVSEPREKIVKSTQDRLWEWQWVQTLEDCSRRSF